MGRDFRFYHKLIECGAGVRLQELDRERTKIYTEFPDLKPPTQPIARSRTQVKQKRGMSPEARKLISVRMKSYWAKRRRGSVDD